MGRWQHEISTKQAFAPTLSPNQIRLKSASLEFLGMHRNTMACNLLTFHQDAVVVRDGGDGASGGEGAEPVPFFSVVSDVYCIEQKTKKPVPVTPAIEKQLQRYIVK